MYVRPRTPQQKFEALDAALSSFRSFTRSPVPGTNYSFWDNKGMHDPPDPKHFGDPAYHLVKRRVDFTSRDAAHPFEIQLGIYNRHPSKPTAGAYLRSHEYRPPHKRTNEANITFKFGWGDSTQSYFVQIHREPNGVPLLQNVSLPAYIKSCFKLHPTNKRRVLVGDKIDATLVRNLILLADFVGQCLHGASVPRHPRTFFPLPTKTTSPTKSQPSNRAAHKRAKASKHSGKLPPKGARNPPRVKASGTRLSRDTQVTAWVKGQHKHRCQFSSCSWTVKAPSGQPFAHAHHLWPLGKPHYGPDKPYNVVCVCPNHHAELDLGACCLRDSGLRKAPGHVIAQRCIDYHNNNIYQRGVTPEEEAPLSKADKTPPGMRIRARSSS